MIQTFPTEFCARYGNPKSMTISPRLEQPIGTGQTNSAMKQLEQTASDSIHPPVIAGVPTGALNRGLFDSMKTSARLKKHIQSGQLSGAELLEMAAEETHDADLKGLLSGAARLIKSHGRQIEAAIRIISEKNQSAGGSL